MKLNEMLQKDLKSVNNVKQSHKIYESIKDIKKKKKHSSALIFVHITIIFRMGNDAFRNGEYEKAISMYSKAIDHVKDSPVLYNNRALTYIRYSVISSTLHFVFYLVLF